MWDVQPGGQFLALIGAPVPRTCQSGMPVGVHVAQAPRPPQHGCARSSEEENVIHTPTPGGLLPPSRVCGESESESEDCTPAPGGLLPPSRACGVVTRPPEGGFSANLVAWSNFLAVNSPVPRGDTGA